MATEHLAEQAVELAMRGGAEQADAYFSAGTSDSVSFDNNRLAQISSGSSGGIGVRVLQGGRVGFSSTSLLERLQDTVDAALAAARLTSAQETAFELPAEVEGGDLADAEVDAITVAELVALGRAAVESLSGLADGVLAGAGLGRYRSSVRLANSRGLRAGYTRSGWYVSFIAQRVEGTSIVHCYDGAASNHRDIDSDAVLASVSDKLRSSLTEGRLEVGHRPVVFTPPALSALLAAVRMGLSGAAVHRKTSPLAGRLGEQVLSEKVTLRDDLRPEAGRAGAPFDDEGLPADLRTPIEAGVLRGFNCDLRFGARLGLPAGRASRAGYASMPHPGAGNQLLEPGDRSLSELLAEAEGGLVVDSLLGMHGSNLMNGDFSANIGLGFALGRGGERLFRVKDAAIAGNVYDLLGPKLAGFSRERRRGAAGTELLPWALVRDVPIAG